MMKMTRTCGFPSRTADCLARAVGRRPCRPLLLLSVALSVAGLVLCSGMVWESEETASRRHAAAFERRFGWLRTRDLAEYVLPGQNTSLLVPHCDTDAAGAPLVVAMVTSAPSHAAARRAIRETWGRARQEIRTVFLVGQPGDADVQAALAAEAAEFNDLLQEPFIEHYQNLTIKSTFMLKYLTSSPTPACVKGAQFFLKVDDDVYVNVPSLVVLLRECAEAHRACADEAAILLGRQYSGVMAFRGTESKYYLPPRLWAEDRLPDFLSGTAYVFSTSAAKPLYTSALRTPFVNLEDVFITGLAASHAQVPIYPAPGFNQNRPLWVHPCTCRGAVTVHGVTPEQQRGLHSGETESCGVLWGIVNAVMPWVVPF